MREDDLRYSLRRAEEEAARSLVNDDPLVAAIHRQLAQAYSKRVTHLIGHPAQTDVASIRASA